MYVSGLNHGLYAEKKRLYSIDIYAFQHQYSMRSQVLLPGGLYALWWLCTRKTTWYVCCEHLHEIVQLSVLMCSHV